MSERLVSEPSKLAKVFIQQFGEKLKAEEIRRVVARALVGALGEASASAVISIIGDEALGNPRAFAQRVTEMFGVSADIIFTRLLPVSEAPSPEVLVNMLPTSTR